MKFLFQQCHAPMASGPAGPSVPLADGYIVYGLEREILDTYRALGRPVVNVSNSCPVPDIPSVLNDDLTTGSMAAEHLLDRGYRQFGVLADERRRYGRERAAGFRGKIEANGGVCSVCPADWVVDTSDTLLTNWLRAMEPPVGLFACDVSDLARLMSVCLRLKRKIPVEMAVVTVSDLTGPDLILPIQVSAVVQDIQRIGWRAAKLMKELLDGHAAPAEPVVVPPLRLEARESSDAMAIADTNVATAMEYIRDHATEKISVDTVARALGISRRFLRQRFADTIGVSPYAFILQERVNRSKALLQNTEMTIKEVGFAVGFDRAQSFSAVFRKKVGCTPLAWRAQHRESE